MSERSDTLPEGKPLRPAARGVTAERARAERRPESDSDHTDSDAAATVSRRLGEHGARTVCLAWSDLLGRAAFSLIPAADVGRAAAGVIADRRATMPDHRAFLFPDQRSLSFVTLDQAASPLAYLTCDRRLPDGAPAATCPRQSLQRVVAACQRAGASVRVILDCRVPARPSLAGCPGSALPYPATLSSLERLVAALAGRLPGLTVRSSGGEDNAGVSLSFGPLSPVDAADALTLVRIAARCLAGDAAAAADAMAAAAGACWPPPALLGLSLSLHRGKRNLFLDHPATGRQAAAFVAGTRMHALGLTALLRPSLGAAATTQPLPTVEPSDCSPGWAWERGWAARLSIRHASADGAVIVTGLDGTGSPYLMLAGLIAAGLDGLSHSASPVEAASAASSPESPEPPKPAEAPEALRYPSDPDTALSELASDAWLRERLGGPTVDAYAAAVRACWRGCGG